MTQFQHCFDALLFRHHEVGDDEVEAGALEKVHGLLSVGSRNDVVACAAKELALEVQNRCVVID